VATGASVPTQVRGYPQIIMARSISARTEHQSGCVQDGMGTVNPPTHRTYYQRRDFWVGGQNKLGRKRACAKMATDGNLLVECEQMMIKERRPPTTLS
jgi:hypothetical protein